MKQITNYPNYSITQDGRVWSHKSEIWLKTQSNGRGYQGVGLRNGGVKRRFLVHRLVAQAFIPNPLGLETVNHINEVKTDNTVANLEWMSREENTAISSLNLRTGEDNPKSDNTKYHWLHTDGRREYLTRSELIVKYNLNKHSLKNLFKKGARCKTYKGWRVYN